MDSARRSVWLSRPAERAGEWQAALEASGIDVVAEPLITIEALPMHARLADQLASAAVADIVIVTSVAVVDALAAGAPDWQPAGQLIAVGQATADALEAFVRRPVATPAQTDSEGLLAMPALRQGSARHIAILAGEGGRSLLADTLAERGVRLDRIALYRRRPARLSSPRLAGLLDRCDALVLTSEAAWRALIDQCDAGARTRLAELFLVASSLRVVQITSCDISWRHAPTVIEPMTAAGVCQALARLPGTGAMSSRHAIPGESDSA